jgi:hypothetical protein
MAKAPDYKKECQTKLLACLPATRALIESHRASLAGVPCTPPTEHQLLSRLLENQAVMIEALWELLD